MMIKADDPLAEVLSLVAQRMTAAKDRASELRDVVTRELELHPFRTLASAVGAGYLLAGGLFSRLTLRFISFGARLVLLPVIAAEIAAAREDADGASVPRPNQRRRPSRTIHHEPQT